MLHQFLVAAAIGAGAALGGMGRYLLSKSLPKHIGTLSANALACLVLGILSHHQPGQSVLLLAALSTGLAGALSTWSTLAKELGILVKENPHHAAYYALATILAGGTGVGIGLLL